MEGYCWESQDSTGVVVKEEEEEDAHNRVSKFIWYFGLQVILNIQLLVTIVVTWLYSK